MSQSRIVSNTIRIAAPASVVWNLLTHPDQTPKYMFGCKTVSDWAVGSSLLWEMDYEGKTLVAVKGTIVAIRPGEFLAYTTIDPNSGIADLPENYLTVTYALQSEGAHTVLHVTQGDYAHVGDGEQRYAEAIAAGGWQTILEQIKTLAEQTGE